MSAEPYNRKQGEFELRVLKDGRVVMIAPDETLLEIAAALDGHGDTLEETSGERNAETTRAERQQDTDHGRTGEASHG
jgi:hypothetical protein